MELFFNGKSLGKKSTDRSTKFIASWQVPYQKGALKAVGYNDKNKIIKTAELVSAQPAVNIQLTTDRTKMKANNQDLCYVTVELTDTKGILNPLPENLIRFEIDGPATIAGTGNANPKSLESYQSPERRAWRGKCLVIIKAGKNAGEIRLRAASDGMQAATLTIKSVTE